MGGALAGGRDSPRELEEDAVTRRPAAFVLPPGVWDLPPLEFALALGKLHDAGASERQVAQALRVAKHAWAQGKKTPSEPLRDGLPLQETSLPPQQPPRRPPRSQHPRCTALTLAGKPCQARRFWPEGASEPEPFCRCHLEAQRRGENASGHRGSNPGQ